MNNKNRPVNPPGGSSRRNGQGQNPPGSGPVQPGQPAQRANNPQPGQPAQRANNPHPGQSSQPSQRGAASQPSQPGQPGRVPPADQTQRFVQRPQAGQTPEDQTQRFVQRPQAGQIPEDQTQRFMQRPQAGQPANSAANGAQGNPFPGAQQNNSQPGIPPQANPYVASQQPRPQSVRRASPLPPDQSIIAKDFRKRLHGKPTHAARTRSWYGGIGQALAMALKLALIAILVVIFAFGGFGGGMLVGYIASTEPLENVERLVSNESRTSFVYDAEGNELAKLTGSDNVDRVVVSYSDVKDTYIDEAITSIEDERFYEHNGIDIQRIGSAIISALVNGGTATHGGSTITQQTVKLISGDDERSAQRKVQEWFRAMLLEQKLSKDEIMEIYINQAPMGNNYIGVQTAAQNYFGKNAKDLTLAECAFLAGIPKSPSYYNPLRESGKRNAMRRMRIVLGKMHELGKITDAQYEEALNTELVFKTKSSTTSTAINSYFVEFAVDEVIRDLMEQRNISYNMAWNLVHNSGYKIMTTLQPTVQSTLDTTYTKQDLFQKDPAAIEDYPEKPESGMVVIDVKNGSIAGMQGGYGTKEQNLVLNRAVDIARQPGSSVKPLIDYAPALQSKLIVPTTTYLDAQLCLNPDAPNTPWPKNSDGNYSGVVTIRTAIRKSINVVAVQVWDDLNGQLDGLPLLYLKDVGIDRTDEVYPATAIGGFNVGMSPLEMAAAYATFANNGVYTEPYAYTKVLDADGNVVLEKTPVTQTVYTPETCFLLTDMLEDVVTGGTAAGHVKSIANASGEGISVAGKTGTTDDNKDKWFCGFTPYYAAATWYGYDNRLRSTVIPKADRSNAMDIWNDAMQQIHLNLPGLNFTKPDTIISLTICTESGNLATEDCKTAGTAVTDYFISGDALTPSTPCTLHVPTPTPTPDPSAPSGTANSANTGNSGNGQGNGNAVG